MYVVVESKSKIDKVEWNRPIFAIIVEVHAI